MKSSENIQSIEDMQRFVENYPAFKSQSINVSKHVALMGELARLVDQRNLMDVSSLEQELASNDAHSEQLAELKEKLASPQVEGGRRVGGVGRRSREEE
jgi:vacuolar protein sorting-associated protein 45